MKPTARMLRQFSAVWLVLFVTLALFREFRAHDRPVALLFIAVAQLGTLGLVWPAIMKWVFIAATIITFPIGWVLSNVILVLIYYLLITPIGFALRASGRDELQLRRNPDRESHWIKRPGEPSPGNYLKQY